MTIEEIQKRCKKSIAEITPRLNKLRAENLAMEIEITKLDYMENHMKNSVHCCEELLKIKK